VIDPAGFSARPEEPLATAVFAVALPSPAFPAARVEAPRPVLRAGSTRIVPVLNGVTFEGPADAAEARAPASHAAVPMAAYTSGPPAPQPIVIVNNPPIQAPDPSYYLVPVYTGIIVVNPPQHKAAPPAVPPDPDKPVK